MNMEEIKSTPMYTRKQLAVLIWPLLFEQFLSVSIGFADTFMVSAVGETAVSGVSLVDMLNNFVIQVLTALSAGGAVIVSQYIGHKDVKSAKKSASQLYFILLVFTGALMLIGIFFSGAILRFVFGAVEDSVMQAARLYFLISAVSYPFIGLYNSSAALFRAQGDSKISMKASLVMNVINIGGNAFMIYVLHLGVLGAAVSSLASRAAAAIWVIAQNQKPGQPLRIDSLSLMRPDGAKIRQILSIGIPSGIENSMFQFGKISVSSLVSTLGTASIAAHAVANSITTLANIPGNTMSLATIPVIGNCLGAGEKKQAKRYAYLFMGVAMAGIIVTNGILFFIIPYVASWFHLSSEALELCVYVVRAFNIFSFFVWATSFTLPNILRCGGDAKFTMTVSMVSMWGCRVFLSYFFVLRLNMGLFGVWLGMFLDWVIRSIFYGARFLSGKWMEHKLI